MIRIDCYLAILKRMRRKYPHAHFEVVTRVAHSNLAPSWDLLNLYKATHMPFERYANLYKGEIRNRPAALARMKELQIMAQSREVFLVCYEKNAAACHRSILAHLIAVIKT